MKHLNILLLLITCLAPIIVGSNTAAIPGEFDPKAVVAIKVDKQKGFCSGAVISPTEIITATHCIYNLKEKHYFPINRIQYGIGKNIEDASFNWLPIKEIKKQTLKFAQSAEDFIGKDIVVLSAAIPPQIKPIAFAQSHTTHKKPVAWGFGEDQWGYFGRKKSRPLKNVSYEEKHIIFTSGACRGDSGGPVLNNNHELVGIISISEQRHCVSDGRRLAQRIR